MAEVVGSNANDAEIFVYTGPRGERVPDDVVRARVDPSVTTIPDNAFYGRRKLTEVELCEGLVEIGRYSFMWCDHSIRKIIIPNSLRRIKGCAFKCSLRCPIRLHDGIESIGKGAFGSCIFTNFRVPPLITVIPGYMISSCTSLFSLELPEYINEICYHSFYNCYSLRNVAFPPNAVIGEDILDEATDLLQLFDSEERIIIALQNRFDGLLIHRIVYYQSYHQGVLQILIDAINLRSGQRRTLRSKLDPTGNQQDCLGMTPLHILACSSVHNIDVYSLIVEKYPTNLITEDSWGALPLLYAFWGAAPTEITQFLIESYQSLYPGHVLNWTMMVETMGICDTPKKRIENLLCVKQMHFPEQPLDWGYLLDEFARSTKHSFGRLLNNISSGRLSTVVNRFQEKMQFLFTCGVSERVGALPFKVWRDHIKNMIQIAAFEWRQDNSAILYRIRDKLTYFEGELQILKEITTILELALWKMKMNEKKNQDMATKSQKKVKTDKSSTRQRCRVTCGADIIISNVLPYIISV